MNKAILMSIQPKWLAKILNGEKTIEIRKTMPKCELPVDVYLYCTKGKPYLVDFGDNEYPYKSGGYDATSDLYNIKRHEVDILNGKVVAKFTLNKVDTFDGTVGHPQLYINACVDDLYCLRTYGEVNAKKLYAYHIDNLVIFDKPKELSEFYGIIHYPKGQFITPDICNYGEGYEEDEEQCLKSFRVNRAPQSWQYIWLK